MTRPALRNLPIACISMALLLASCKDGPEGDPPRTDTAGGTKPAPAIDTTGMPAFSGRNAYDYVAAQVSFGPRNPGSPGAAKALEMARGGVTASVVLRVSS